MDTNALRQQWLAAIEKAPDPGALAELDTRLFGSKGEVVELVRSVTSLPNDRT